jgi:hypothetical protein
MTIAREDVGPGVLHDGTPPLARFRGRVARMVEIIGRSVPDTVPQQ